MAETDPLGRWLGRALWASLAVGIAGVLYVTSGASIKPDDGRAKPASVRELADYATGPLAKLTVSTARPPPPQTAFTGPAGERVRLGGFEGRVTVVNLWATWCPPCKTEMPSLARLAAAAPEVRVLPVSLDGPAKLDEARAFIAGNAPLAFYHSAQAELAWALDAEGFPTTVIYGKDGRERARLARPAEWDAPEVRALLTRLEAEPDG